MAMRNPIIAALDVSEAGAALKLARELAPTVGCFKIGNELFTTAGPDIVRRIRELGIPVFLDLKFHDIPNTVAKGVRAAVHLDVQMLTVHTSGGLAMLQAAERAAQEAAAELNKPAPIVLGVTVLTSLDGTELNRIGFSLSVEKQVERLAGLAVDAGLRGLVCSPLEIRALRRIIPKEMALVTPGIRASTDATNDQKRTMGPKEAIEAGANWLVIGRPICAAANPRAAAENILAQIQKTA
jgi:orotidine-5'-phosphate decarboxylase